MKLTVISLMVMVAVVSCQGGKKKSMLFGADDVDKKAAEMLAGEKKVQVAPHKNLKEIKKLAQGDRVQLKQMQSRARELKTEMTSKAKSKSEKKALKKEFRELKQHLHSKKAELVNLKSEMKLKKEEKKLKPHRDHSMKKGQREDPPKDLLFMSEKKELSLMTTTTGKPAPTTAPTTAPPTTIAALLEFNNKFSARRKSQRKGEKKNKKGKNKNRAWLNGMQSDQPVANHQEHRRPTCESDVDCQMEGSKCLTNKKGHKHCRFPHGKNKSAGKKCHSSRQCMKGLQCFVTLSSEQQHHKKHPRRGKGTCADPDTTDASKGKFLPLVVKAQQ